MSRRSNQSASSPPKANLWGRLAIATNWPILVAVAVLVAIGTVSIGSKKPDDAANQLKYVAAGIVALGLFQVVNYLRIGRFAWGFYLGSLVLVLYTGFAPRMGLPFVPNINGAHAWIRIGPMSLQPAELTKIGFIMVLARYLRFRSNYRTFLGLLPPFVLALIPLALIMLQPDLGTALTFIPALFAMLFVAGAKVSHLLWIVLLALCLALFGWFSGPESDGAPGLPILRHLPAVVKGYQRQRVYAMFSNDPRTLKEAGFQQHNSLIAIGSGGIAGKGFGNIPVGRYVPEAHNDMIFALIGEQFGFLGSLVVLVAYIVLFAAGIEIAAATREPFGRLVAVGVVAVLAGQTFINLLVAMKLMPVTGITLPFVSYGGSSLLASFVAAGLLLNIGQYRPLVMARESFQYD